MTKQEMMEGIASACDTTLPKMVKAWFIKLILTLVFWLPVLIFGPTVTTVLVTLFVYKCINRSIEMHFSGECAAMYSIRHFLKKIKVQNNG